MPNRILKESIRTSPNYNACSVEARDLFIRLIATADDYGRFEADGSVLRAACYPRLLDQTTTAQVERWRDELASPDLPDGPCIRLYEAKGRLYGYSPTWFDHQRPARSKSKHPAPPRKSPPAEVPQPQDVVVQPPNDHNAPQIDDNCQQPAAVCNPTSGVVSREARVEKRDSLRAGDDADTPALRYTPKGFLVSDDLLDMWARAYPALDIQGEVHRAHAWTLANPANRKSNWHRFLVGWLKREQDRAPRRTMQESATGAGPAPSVPHVPIRPAVLAEQGPPKPMPAEFKRQLATLAQRRAMP